MGGVMGDCCDDSAGRTGLALVPNTNFSCAIGSVRDACGVAVGPAALGSLVSASVALGVDDGRDGRDGLEGRILESAIPESTGEITAL